MTCTPFLLTQHIHSVHLLLKNFVSILLLLPHPFNVLLVDSAWTSGVRSTQKEVLLRALHDIETQLMAVNRVLSQLMMREDLTSEGLQALHERFVRVEALVRYVHVVHWFLAVGFADLSPGSVTTTPSPITLSNLNVCYERLNSECATRRKRRTQQHNSHRWEVDPHHMRGTRVSDPPELAGRLSVDLLLQSLHSTSPLASPSEHSPRYPHRTLPTFLHTLYSLPATPTTTISVESEFSSFLYCIVSLIRFVC